MPEPKVNFNCMEWDIVQIANQGVFILGRSPKSSTSGLDPILVPKPQQAYNFAHIIIDTEYNPPGKWIFEQLYNDTILRNNCEPCHCRADALEEIIVVLKAS